MGISDEGVASLKASTKAEIKKFGSTKIDSIQYRFPWAFFGSRKYGKF